MKLARVAGTVVSTFNAPVFDNQRLLLCDYLNPAGEPTGVLVDNAVDLVREVSPRPSAAEVARWVRMAQGEEVNTTDLSQCDSEVC